MFSQSVQDDFTKRRYGIKSCKIGMSYEYLYDIYNLYKRALEKDDCGICDDPFCCTKHIEEIIKTM